jgi:hypothetical protein
MRRALQRIRRQHEADRDAGDKIKAPVLRSVVARILIGACGGLGLVAVYWFVMADGRLQ